MLMVPGEVTFQEVMKNIRSLGDKELSKLLPFSPIYSADKPLMETFVAMTNSGKYKSFEPRIKQVALGNFLLIFSIDPRPTH